MSAPRTLRNLRADAPMPDRVSAALAATGIANPYVYASQPQTLDELRERCGKHGAAAVETAKWGCVSGWCMSQHPFPAKWANAARLLSQDAYSRITGKSSPTANMDAHQRKGIGRSAVEAQQAWEAAGSPRLVRSIREMHQLIYNLERIKAEEAEAQTNNEEEGR